MSRDQSSIAAIRQFQSETDAIREAPEPRWAKLTVFALAALLAAVIVVMVCTQVDRVITSQSGRIVSTRDVSVFQALDPSIIRSIDVREGERVKNGQILATLDPTFAAADVEQLRLQIASLEAQIARIEAELKNTRLSFADSSDPGFLQYAALQTKLYEQRTVQFNAQIDSFNAKIAQTRATIQKLEESVSRFRQREEIAGRVLAMKTSLAKQGSGSQLNALISEDQHLEILQSLEKDQHALTEAQYMIGALEADRDAFRQQWLGALSQELVTARNGLDTAKTQIEKAIKRQDLVRLTANEESVVLTMAKLSVGSVLKQGDPLLTLMPANAPLEAEVRIASRDIAFVRNGDRCVLKIDAFNFAEHGAAEGKVRWISEGAFTTDDNGQPAEAYYRARCSIDAIKLTAAGPNFRLIPGMTLTADMNVGTRSVAAFLLSGFIRGVGESMREP
ncbi:HlyD family type I secretion periplasmic adaptor subunit [Mesorhizobium sp. VK9D]|uniref:HlyD family type I secretion periplasmic adaptor subunit n=1 Tax=Mesorhizobium australafricanum TaxID=3072311 RepID=UPI002A24945F|nr:HlyD family type I secretion periplasmic adaptor subunit [Mesorhizobium sp. VK9D]MDX8456004.1 HlyD family type I secretion periplasmic adaptor subunit [Mesorhizobium sp. VK9D]